MSEPDENPLAPPRTKQPGGPQATDIEDVDGQFEVQIPDDEVPAKGESATEVEERR